MMHQQFLQAIIENPEDDLPRLAYADWLNEQNGGVDPPRAEFIRVQCELAKTPGPFAQTIRPILPSVAYHEGEGVCTRCTDTAECRWHVLLRRERELLHATKPGQWSGFPEELHNTDAASWSFRRGFVEHIRLSARDWLAHADELVQAAPLREVELTSLPPRNLRGEAETFLKANWPRIKFVLPPEPVQEPETHTVHWAGSVLEVPAAEDIAIGELVYRTPDGRVRRTRHRDGAVGVAVRSSEYNFVRVHLFEPFPAD